ncbi:MAG: sigma-54-dependent Fis family transcriptional regulator [Candidatus Krumholzibacteriota bacterium]|nr:sigma-54-dependent Fis family transcriptional regulator [Candidatus Krumholzibacteriota bacterium]
MLIRLVLIIKDKTLEKGIREYFNEANVRLESIGHLKNPFQKALRTNGDIFIVSSSLLPEPLESSISLLNDLPETPTTVVLHDSNSPEDHANLIAMGADVVLYQGLQKNILIEAVETTIYSRRNLVERPITGEGGLQKPRIETLIAHSPQMQILMEMVGKIIGTSSPILLLGETGVGKEHLARMIHAEGQRAAAPFIAVNCAALPEQLLESELFGHEAGAFTGAVRQRRGAFELAHSGTLLLDEIGELPIHMQAKLLRVLQDYEVKPVGGEKSIWVDVRVIATTNRQIEKEIEKDRFRKDLYFRLSVLSLTVPPLRERKEDIPFFVEQFIDRFSMKMNKLVEGISEEAMDALIEYSWPGNVRELINVMERAIILCQGDMITLGDLPQGIYAINHDYLSMDRIVDNLDPDWRNQQLKDVKTRVIEKVESSYLKMVLSETGGRVGEAARRAGIHPRGLYDKMRHYGLRKEDFRGDADKPDIA